MTSRLRERRRKRLLRISAAVCGALLSIFLLCWGFLSLSSLRISTVEVSGVDVLPPSAIKEAVEHSMEGKYAYLFPKNSIFLYPKADIAEELRTLFPTLKAVSVNAKNFHTVTVVVSERTPSALWCGSTADGVNSDTGLGEQCLLLDDSGLAYANAPEYSGKVYQQYYGALPEGPLPKQFLTAEKFQSLAALAQEFEKKVTPDVLQSITVDSNADVHLSFDSGYEIRFALTEDTGLLLDRFLLTLTAAPFTEHKLSDFYYIDLRFGDKVYYKLKNE